MRICLQIMVDLREADDGPNFDWGLKIWPGNLNYVIENSLFELLQFCSKGHVEKNPSHGTGSSSLRQRLDSFIFCT